MYFVYLSPLLNIIFFLILLFTQSHLNGNVKKANIIKVLKYKVPSEYWSWL